MTAAPLFVLGAPRSGTSLLYKALCLHPEAAWISNYVRRAPGVPALSVLNRAAAAVPERRRRVWFGADGANAYVYSRARRLGERLFPMPVEGEPLFARCGLGTEQTAIDEAGAAALRGAFDAIARASGGRVVVSKRIGHNRRIPALHAAFPQARFVDLLRDGRAVAHSLSRVDWWPAEHVWWYDGTPRDWEAEGRDPWELCARHWVAEIGAIAEGLAAVPAAQVLQVRYEALVRDPLTVLAEIAAFAGLPADPRWEAELAALSFPDKNETWRDRLDPAVIARVEALQAEALADHGYRP
jgi:hypothetical protein